MMKNQKGITLIALVITIIVLLILAGVSIAMLTGENGVLTKAKLSQKNSNEGEIADRINMALNAVYTDILADEIKGTEIKTHITKDGIKSANGFDKNDVDDKYEVEVTNASSDDSDTEVTVVKIEYKDEKMTKTGKITYQKGKYGIDPASYPTATKTTTTNP